MTRTAMRPRRPDELPKAWLVCEGRVLASADVAETARSRRRGLIGASEAEIALVLTPCNWVHSIGMRHALDIAYLDPEGTVLKTHRLAPFRAALPVRGARSVIEAAGGSFSRWGVEEGRVIEVRRAT